jgi:hypothetical protein
MVKKILQQAEMRPLQSARARATEPGEPMNFRVPPELAREIRVYAAENRLRLSEVLSRAFRALRQQEAAE